MTQVGEGIAVTQVKDPEEDHWAQLEYTYPDGSPVQGMFTAKDGAGMTWTGYLNDQGQACLSGLPSGSVEYQLLPSESLDDELQDLRSQIQTVLDGILEEQRAEAKAHQDELDKQSTLGKSYSYTAAVGRGLWNGAIGLLTFAKDVVVKVGEVALFLSPITRMNNLLQASYTSYRNGELTWAEWRESLTKNYQDEEFKDLADLIGIDIRNLDKDEVLSIVTEAYEIVAYIADDAEFREMFIQFGKDYAGAQSGIEWAEFAGGGLFEIVLTALLLAFTGGLGNVAQAASKVRHAARLRTLGGMLRKLGKLLQRKKLSRKTTGGVDSKHKVEAEKPEGQRLSSDDKKPDRNNIVGRTVVEERAHVTRLSDEAAEAEKRGDLALRDAKIAEARGFLRERVLDNPNIPNEKKPQALIDRLEVGSQKDKSIFWSGDKNAAKRLAHETDKVCLETTSGGRIADDWKELDTRFPGWEGDPPPNGYDMWGGLSEKYASGVTGDVTVIQTADRAAQGGGYIWKSKEAPVLQAGQKAGRVGKITTIVIGQ